MTIKASIGNQWIKDRLIGNEPFLATKMGAIEQRVIFSKMARHSLDGIRYLASAAAGITPSDDDTLDFFSEAYAISLSYVDIIGLMGEDIEDPIISTFAPAAIRSELRLLEPFYFESPWSENLAGKRVLVVHPFEESIKSQYSKRELLFKNKNVLPDFELLTIKAEQTNGGGVDGSKPFRESLSIMLDKMSSIDYDVAIIGCGAYGLMLARHAKLSGKSVIHIGGGLQILFGIKGGRWDVHPDISPLYNEHWVRPLESEKPRNHMVVENGTYW
jgi:hypothetical protein